MQVITTIEKLKRDNFPLTIETKNRFQVLAKKSLYKFQFKYKR